MGEVVQLFKTDHEGKEFDLEGLNAIRGYIREIEQDLECFENDLKMQAVLRGQLNFWKRHEQWHLRRLSR
ncbi:MAG: hypothetical protein K9K82_09305 [Desulfobacteraceae bacterium]|nr:hypothetical protein [Desulfobacteraceae bacterium]